MSPSTLHPHDQDYHRRDHLKASIFIFFCFWRNLCHFTRLSGTTDTEEQSDGAKKCISVEEMKNLNGTLKSFLQKRETEIVNIPSLYNC